MCYQVMFVCRDSGDGLPAVSTASVRHLDNLSQSMGKYIGGYLDEAICNCGRACL